MNRMNIKRKNNKNIDACFRELLAVKKLPLTFAA